MSPVTRTFVALLLVPNCVKLVPSVDVKTSYPVKVPQELSDRQAGAFQETARFVSPGTTLRFSTASVVVTGVTAGEVVDAAPVPAEFVAVTVIV